MIEIKNRWTGATILSLDLANLTDANLTDADLTRADLTGANLTRANLTAIKADFFRILKSAPAEIPALRNALVEGHIDGSTYEGECACLVGTIANARRCPYEEIPGVAPDSSRPAERWFLAIGRGDTPESNPVAKVTLEWTDEFLASLAVPAKS
jgi:hypothetical protein